VCTYDVPFFDCYQRKAKPRNSKPLVRLSITRVLCSFSFSPLLCSHPSPPRCPPMAKEENEERLIASLSGDHDVKPRHIDGG
jgi:hypothetical protein